MQVAYVSSNPLPTEQVITSLSVNSMCHFLSGRISRKRANMVVGKVTGRLVSTRKHENLIGNKFLICQLIGNGTKKEYLVAIDTVGAGIGEDVMIVTGSGARLCIQNQDAPVDAAIIGIIDEENNLDILKRGPVYEQYVNASS